MPTTNIEFWQKKIGGNQARDRLVLRELKKQRWKVLVLWECQLNSVDVLARRLVRFLDV